MSTLVHKRLFLIVAWCTAGLALVATVTVSGGNVQVKNACAQGCPSVATLEKRLAALENLSPGAVGIGTIIAHTTHLVGSTSIDEMRAAGFAVCDGTTPERQGIIDAVLTDPTPALDGRFLRGAATSGGFQVEATAANGLVAIVNQTAHTHTQAPHGHSASGGAHDHGLNAHKHVMDHVHLTPIADFSGFCNSNAVPNTMGALPNPTDWSRASGSGCHYKTSPAKQIATPASGRSSTDGSTGNTTMATPAISIAPSTATNNPATVGIAVSIASSDSETRPANMSVVWMMRVR